MKALRAALAAHKRQSLVAQKRAAVLVPLIDDEAGPLRLLLTRRTEHLPTHKGQVAFPGGGVDPTDADADDAALREAEEEVGLPRGHVELLGQLDDLPTIHRTTIVTPVVGRVAQLPPLRPEPGEVARIFTIPVAALQARAGWRVQHTEWGGQSWPVYYFDHDGETLWGLSAIITLRLLSFLPGGAPFDLTELVQRRVG